MLTFEIPYANDIQRSDPIVHPISIIFNSDVAFGGASAVSSDNDLQYYSMVRLKRDIERPCSTG